MTDGRTDATMGSQRRRNKRAAAYTPKNLRLGSIQGDERRPRDLERRQGLLAARSTAANRYTWLREQTKTKGRKGCLLVHTAAPTFLSFSSSSPPFSPTLDLYSFTCVSLPVARLALSKLTLSQIKFTRLQDRFVLQTRFLEPP